MIEIRKQLNAPKMESYPSLGDPEKALFFDIETTGLSPYGSALYLIGAASVKDGAVEFCQWFSESLSDEIPVLRAFAEYVKGFDYHCANSFYAYAEVTKAIFGTEGEAVCEAVMADFEQAYGPEMTAVLKGYADTNFNVCD